MNTQEVRGAHQPARSSASSARLSDASVPKRSGSGAAPGTRPGTRAAPSPAAVADQVVVDEERRGARRGARSASSSRPTCSRLFMRGPRPNIDDDVAELAAERAAARELERRHEIAVELEQIEARRRRVGAARPCRSPGRAPSAAPARSPRRTCGQMYSASPATTVSARRSILLGTQRGVAAARDDVVAACGRSEQLRLARELHAHAAHADEIGRRARAGSARRSRRR